MWSKIHDTIKTSIRNRDSETLNFARNLKTKINEYLVEKRLARNEVDDDVVELVAVSYQKSLKKALIDFEKSDSDNARELIRTYKNEIEFCNQFTPETDIEIVRELIVEAVRELGPSNIGKIIGHVMKNNKGLDGMLVKEIVNEVVNA